MRRHWEPSGSGFEIPWGGKQWTLRVDSDQPGLTRAGSPSLLLALEGAAAVSRRDPAACTGSSLTRVETRFNRVIATYTPPGWGGLLVRATWTPAGEYGIYLELQVNAHSVGELSAIELFTSSTLHTVKGPAVEVTPRDAPSAGLSYDGREPLLDQLLTQPPRPEGPSKAWVAHDPANAGWLYAEFAHPHDESRLLIQPPAAVRHGFFGYDLERGVVLRARLQGLWVPEGETWRDLIDQEQADFLRQPVPLTT